MKEKLGEIEKHEDIGTSVENVKTAIRKMANWKAPGSHCVQKYWFKRFSTLHSTLTEHLQSCVVVSNVSTWMTKGKTTLIQNDPGKENANNNYRPIALQLCGSCWLVSWQKKFMYTFPKRMCYRMSTRDAEKTQEE